jgi:hypothetical protein
VPEIIDPVFAKPSQNARFLLSENERFGLVFVKTGSINSGTGYIRDLAKFPGCFQDVSRIVEWGVGDFIPKPGFLYLFRSRKTFSNWKKEKSRMGNVQNFPLTTMGVFPDQE